MKERDVVRVLCVCVGNSDRSPVMAAVLNMFLNNSGLNVYVESAGADECAKKGGSCTEAASFAASRIGLDLSGHERRYIGDIEESRLSEYDLFVVVSDEVAAKVLGRIGFERKEDVYNVNIQNPWPNTDQRTHDETFRKILVAMYDVITLYF